MFPSPEYIQECIENRDKLPEWEPRPGDWGALQQNRNVISVVDEASGWGQWKHFWLWLPRLDQLIEMLEERGYHYVLGGGSGEHTADVFRGIEEPKIIKAPDPATALLKCLLEVIGKEK